MIYETCTGILEACFVALCNCGTRVEFDFC